MKIYQYCEILTIEKENYETLSEYYIEMAAIFMNISTEEAEEMSYIDVIQKQEELSSSLNKAKVGIEEFQVDDVAFRKAPFNRMTLGEFIDLENYLKNQDDLAIIAVIYKQFKETGFGAIKYEEYGDYVEKRKALFQDQNALQLIGAVKEYIEWREGFMNNYGAFFSLGEDGEEEDLTDFTANERKQHYNELAKERERQQFSWERVIMNLANDDITKAKEVLSLSVVFVFNIMSMTKLTSE